jgi:Ca2+-binding RTX toxin-like protein
VLDRDEILKLRHGSAKITLSTPSTGFKEIKFMAFSPTLVFVDTAIDNYQSLALGVVPSAEVLILDPAEDGVEQITAALAERSQVESVHVFSHGEPGTLHIGSTRLDLETLDRYATQLQQWTKAFTAQAELLLYGCYVAAGDRGTQFVQQISTLTQASVAASTNLTGSSALGGDWVLERKIGTIQSTPVLQPAIAASYGSVLVAPTFNLIYAVTDFVDSSGNTVSQLRTLDLSSTGGYTGTGTVIATLPFQTFALARDANTGRVYFTEAKPNGRIAYYDPLTNTSTILSSTTGINTSLLKLAQAADGTIYGFESTTSTLYSIDPNTGALSPLGAIAGLPASSGDIAFDPTNPDRLFVAATRAPDPNNANNGTFDLYTVSIQTRQATLIGRVPTLTGANAGSLAFGQDGQLYAVDGTSLYQLNQTTAAATLIASTRDTATGQATVFTDFATLPTPTARIDITLTKTGSQTAASPGIPVVYTIKVTNDSPTFDLNGIRVSDVVNSTVTGATWTAAITGNGSFPTLADQSGSGTINATVNLNAGAFVTYTLRGTIDPSTPVGSTLTNSATATLPPGVVDDNTPNNTGTVTIPIVPPGNLPPVAVKDNANTPQDTPVTINALTNDSDPNNDPLTIIGTTNGSRGTVVINNAGTPNNPTDDRVVYTPNSGSTGTDTFTYTISDGKGGTSTATITVDIIADIPTKDDDCKPGITRIGNRKKNTLIGDGDINTLRGRGGKDKLYGLGCDDFLDGGSGNDLLNGGTGNDVLKGRRGRDKLLGGSGVDLLNGGKGRDLLRGGTGADLLLGGGGLDRLRGEQGNDLLKGGQGNDRLFGGPGSDLLRGGAGDDFLRGGNRDELSTESGADRLNGGGGDDFLRGGGGNDLLLGGSGVDRLRGEQDNDLIKGNRGNDRLFGGAGQDALQGGQGSDFLSGGTEADNLNGGAGSDILSGGSDDDVLQGRGGEDRLRGDRGDDQLEGNKGNDRLNGGRGNDILQGQQGQDILNGGRGNDQLFGNSGRDSLRGGNGNDILTGGAGVDVLQGGGGADTFVYTSRKDRNDRILDFQVKDDAIDLSSFVADGRFGSSTPFTSYIRISQSGSAAIVNFDFNGNSKPGGFRSLVTLDNVRASAITAKNFTF